MADEVEFPKRWRLSPLQELVIGSMVDEPGEYISHAVLCDALYGEIYRTAPAKLRVLVQKCREIVSELTEDEVEIFTRRGKGWKLTQKGARILREMAEEDNAQE